MATRDEEIGVAWIAQGATEGRAGFARVTSTLAVIPAPSCMGTETSKAIALAATASGWIIAAENEAGDLIDSRIDVIALDAAGAVVARHTFPNAQAPALIARPGEGPLLLFNDSRSQHNSSPTETVLRGALLNLDASIGAGPAMILPTVTQDDAPAGVFVGDGFVVAQSTTAVMPNGGIQLARVGPDLSAQPGASIAGNAAFGARFAGTSSGIVMTYEASYDRGSDIAFGSFWRQVDGNAALVGAPVLLPSPYGMASGVVPIAAMGNEAWIVEAPLVGTLMPQGVRVAHLDSTGAPVTADFRIDQGPGPADSAIAFLGNTPVIGWLSKAPAGRFESATPGLWLTTLPALP
jgi:hypothetical protein